MNLQIFSVFDEKADAYISPFFLPNIAMAIRAFTESATDENHSFGRHPSDYTLYHLGDFDPLTAEIMPAKNLVLTATEARAAVTPKTSPVEPKGN